MRNDTYLYTDGLDAARRSGQIALWRASHQANIACKKAIEDMGGGRPPTPIGKVSPHLRAFSTRGRRTKKKQAERAGVVNAPALSLLPAVRAVSGFSFRGRESKKITPAGS